MPFLFNIVAESPDLLKEGEKVVRQVSGFDYMAFMGEWTGKLLSFGVKVVIAILIFFLGRWIINRLVKVVRKALLKRSFDLGAVGFLLSTTKTLLYILLLVIVVNALGFQAVSFAALLASAGVTIGMALSGQLQNFAGGAILLFTRPFKVGDYIESSSEAGTVETIGVFHTVVNTPDNKKVYIPNGSLTSNAIINYSEQNHRRLSWNIQTPYSGDYEKIQTALLEILHQDERILSDPAPEVLINELAENGVRFVVRGWCLSADYWPLYHGINEKILNKVRQENFDLALPHRIISHSSK